MGRWIITLLRLRCRTAVARCGVSVVTAGHEFMTSSRSVMARDRGVIRVDKIWGKCGGLIYNDATMLCI